MGGKTKTTNTQTENQTENTNLTTAKNYTTTGTRTNTLDQNYLNQFDSANTDYKNVLGSYTGPTFSSQPNALTNYYTSQATQGILGQQNQANAKLARSLNAAGGNNSALLGVLQRQNQIANAGALNSLQPAAMQMQLDYDNAANSANLAGYQAKLGGYGNLMSQLSALAQAGATTNTTETNTGTDTTTGTTTRSGTIASSGKVKKSFF